MMRTCLFSLGVQIPLLRSIDALRRESLRLFSVLGEKQHESVHTDSGLEQEFFLINRSYYDQRPDLMSTGRTLMGAAPIKGRHVDT
jgi:glutamine synthetase